MSTSAPAKQLEPAAPEKPSGPVAKATQLLATYTNSRSLILPADYSVENAMMSAMLMLQTLPAGNSGLAINVCTQASIVNALLDMCVQGLNPAKKQCYFIPYGNALSCQRSYFGDIAVAKRVMPGLTPYYDVVLKGEKLVRAKIRSRFGFVTTVAEHEQLELRDMRLENIEQAYAGAYLVDENSGELLANSDMDTVTMTIDQIKESWKKSKTIGPNSFHHQQPDQACLRTVIRRFCKPIINASRDALLLEAVARQEISAAEGAIDAEISEHANGVILDLTPAIEAPAPAKDTKAKAAAPETAPDPEEATERLELEGDY